MKVKNMTSANGNKIANQFIIESDNFTMFQSYESTIIVIDYSKQIIYVHPDYNYSKTTGKYRNLFFNYCGLYELNTLAKLEKAMKNGCITINNHMLKVETIK
jgi:hypothetical protein